MPSDDILDLIGRYSTGSLTAEEQQRLFTAALNDQELFDQLAREQDLKQLLDEPGVRDRMIRALEPPRRKTAWIFGVAATAALSAALMVILLRPTPKPPPQLADAKIPASTEVAQPESAPPPVATPTPAAAPAPVREETRRAEAPVPKTVTPVSQASTDAPLRDAVKKEKDQPAPAAPPVPALPRPASARMQVQAIQPLASQQQNAPGGPRQNNADQARSGAVNGAAAKAQDVAAGAFGFHYSTETQGHLSIIPAVDGYLFVKSNDGTVLFGPKLSAAGIIVDLPLAAGVTSAVITFSENSSPVNTTPVPRTDPNGSAEGAGSVAIQVKINP